MDREGYIQSQRRNLAVHEVYKRLNLPDETFYSLFDAIYRRNANLQQDRDYLILLTTIWSPICHMMQTFLSPAAELLASADWQNDFISLYPQDYAGIIDTLNRINQFYRHTSEFSINFNLRIPAYCKLMFNQRNMINRYHEWFELYQAHLPNMRSETKQLTASDEYEEVDPLVREALLLIFQEYVENLMVDPKNRAKYTAVKNRLARYLKAVHRENSEDHCSSDDADGTDNADDVIGSVFDLLIINATRYEPLSMIGPAYICWIFEKRILKIGNPKDKHVNLLMDKGNTGGLFPLNITAHSWPTVADEAQIYMFDELCALWEKYDLGDVALSKFLFERITPYYYDFLKYDTVGCPGKPTVTHKYIEYPISMYTNEFLQRALGCISENLRSCEPNLPDKAQITWRDWHDYFGLVKERDEVPFLIKIFARYETLIGEYNSLNISSVQIDFRQLLRAVYETATQETFLKQFEKLYFLNNCGPDFYTSPDEWLEQNDKFMMDLLHSINFQWYEDPEELLCKSEKLSDALSCAICLISAKSLIRSCEKRILELSKEALFREYSDEQYMQLCAFCGKPLVDSDTWALTPVHFSRDGPIVSDKWAVLPISISKSL